MRIALTGNPNSGKTSFYNAITGKSEKVGNWAGVTIEKKEGNIKKSYCDNKEDIIAVDLPGAYSISAFTSEESITSDYIKNAKPEAIINIVDGTNLSRSLFFTTQILQLGIPVVVALNKSDINQKKKTDINTKLLSEKLNCPVVETSCVGNLEGLDEVIKVAMSLKGKTQKPAFTGEIENASEEVDRQRYDFVSEIVGQVQTKTTDSAKRNTQDKFDSVIAHKWLGIPIFAAVMYAIFHLSQTYIGPFLQPFLMAPIEWINTWASGLVENSSPIVQAILIDGIIGGVGAVIEFLPLIMVLFFLIALLEDCGYMARVAVVMDRFFKKVGLSGKSIIPMVIGTSCAIPGIMASRTIKDETQRRATAMLTPFIPCGAKLPVIALFAGVFFADAAWVGTSMYFIGIALIILGALVIKKITGYEAKNSFFIIELPEWKFPSIGKATMSTLLRGKAFIVKAGTVILLCNTVVQIMQTFTWSFEVVSETAQSTSILSSVASPFALILIPLGFGTWQLAAAAITGFIAKENVVGTLAVVYSLSSFIDVEELALTGGATDVASVMGITSIAALAYLVFNLFTPPCFAAIGSMNSEMQDKKWLWAAIGLQLGTGYTLAFFIYQIGTLVTLGTLGAGFIPGLIAVAAMLYYVFYLIKKGSKKKVTA